MPRNAVMSAGLIPLVTGCAVGLMATPLLAASILLEGSSISIELQSGSMAGTLDDGIQIFSAEDLMFMQDELAADGIQTSGHISLLLADTGNGLAFINLFDGSAIPARGLTDTSLGFNSLAGANADRHWNNDAGGTVSWYDFGLTQMVDGTFDWEAGVTSEGFAWSNLQEGDVGTTSFIDLGLDKLMPDMLFQFITWNGDSWEVAATGDFEDGSSQYNLSYYVNQIPGPATLSLFMLAAARRRRRR